MIIRHNKKEKDFDLFNYKEPEKIEIEEEKIEEVEEENQEEEKKQKNKKRIILLASVVIVFLVLLIIVIALLNGKKYTLNIDNNQVVYVGDEKVIEATVTGKNIENIKNIGVKTKINNPDILNYIDSKIEKNKILMSFNGLKDGTSNVNIISTVNNKKVNKTIKIHVCNKINSASFSDETIYVPENSVINLPLNVGSSSYCMKDIKFNSNNESVAKIDSGALVSNNSGETDIVIKQNEFEYTLKVIVSNNINRLNDIVVDSENISLLENERHKINVNLENVSSKYLIWESSNEDVVKVNQKGIVFAVGLGNAIITIKTTDGSNLSKKISVSVSKYRNVVDAKVNNENLELYVGDTSKIEHSLLPENSEYSSISYNSSNTKIATVSNEGIITGIKAGTAQITLVVLNKDESKITKKINVNVISKPSGNSTSTPNSTPSTTPKQSQDTSKKRNEKVEEYINVEQILFGRHFLKVGKRYKLCYKILPVDADIKQIDYEVIGGDDLASINSQGIITTKELGATPQIRITITNMDGTKISNYTRISIREDELLYKSCTDKEQVYQ